MKPKVEGLNIFLDGKASENLSSNLLKPQNPLSATLQKYGVEVNLGFGRVTFNLGLSYWRKERKMKELIGSPGKVSGLVLRLGQCGFAAASIGVMASASGFSSYTAFWYFPCSSVLNFSSDLLSSFGCDTNFTKCFSRLCFNWSNPSLPSSSILQIHNPFLKCVLVGIQELLESWIQSKLKLLWDMWNWSFAFVLKSLYIITMNLFFLVANSVC